MGQPALVRVSTLNQLDSCRGPMSTAILIVIITVGVDILIVEAVRAICKGRDRT